MSAVQPSLSGGSFHQAFAMDQASVVKGGERLLTILALGTVLIDVLVVTGGFLVAYWVRFILPEDEVAALGLHEYARIGAWVALTAVLLMALQGVYDRHRRFPWPNRLHVVVSAVSTALIIAVTISYALGDQRISRLWFAAGWLFAVVSLMAWRTAAQYLMTVSRATINPMNRAIIVGANPLGHQVAQELAGRFDVLGYIDNGSDLDGGQGLPLLGPIADLPRIVHGELVDALIITLAPDRRDQVGSVICGLCGSPGQRGPTARRSVDADQDGLPFAHRRLLFMGRGTGVGRTLQAGLLPCASNGGGNRSLRP